MRLHRNDSRGQKIYKLRFLKKTLEFLKIFIIFDHHFSIILENMYQKIFVRSHENCLLKHLSKILDQKNFCTNFYGHSIWNRNYN